MQIPPKITKNNSQGILFAIISCQRVSSWQAAGEPPGKVGTLELYLGARLSGHTATQRSKIRVLGRVLGKGFSEGF